MFNINKRKEIKKHLLDHPVCFNYKCRKCNQIIYQKVISKEKADLKWQYDRITITKRSVHKNCNIEDGERVFCDLISVSNNPLPESIYMFLEEEYNNEFIDYKEEN